MTSETGNHKRDDGLTLIELTVSAAILAVGLTAVLQAFSMSARMSGVAGDINQACLLAQEKLQEIDFKETNGWLSQAPLESEEEYEKFKTKYSLNLLDTAFVTKMLDFQISWERANRHENINIKTILKK